MPAKRPRVRISFSSKPWPRPTASISRILLSRRWRREGFEHRAQRGIELGDGVGLGGDGAINGGGEPGHERIHQGEEDRLFVGEVKVEAALRAIRGANDVIHHRAVVALLGKDLFGGIEQPLTGRVFIAGGMCGMLASRARLPAAIARSDARCLVLVHSASPSARNLRTDAPVC